MNHSNIFCHPAHDDEQQQQAAAANCNNSSTATQSSSSILYAFKNMPGIYKYVVQQYN